MWGRRKRANPSCLRASFFHESRIFLLTGQQNRGKIPSVDESQPISGGNDGEVPPVSIPNTEVKLSNADGTWDAGPWESRTPPGIYIPR